MQLWACQASSTLQILPLQPGLRARLGKRRRPIPMSSRTFSPVFLVHHLQPLGFRLLSGQQA